MKINEKLERDLLDKIKHIGFLDFKKVDEHLKNLESISEKLNYLKVLKELYYDKFENVLKSLEHNRYQYFLNNKSVFWKRIFSEEGLRPPFQIPNFIHEKHFKKEANNSKYTFWILEYSASLFFNALKEDFDLQLRSLFKDDFILAKLKELDDFDNRAKKLMQEGEITLKDLEGKYGKRKYNFEIELLRIKMNYYKENPLLDEQNSNVTYLLYAEHIYFYKYLENELNKFPKPQFSKELTIKQIALKYVYENKLITRFNCNNIIKEFGLNSGDKLYQNFSYFSNRSNRKGRPEPYSKLILQNKINLFKSVIKILSIEHKQQAKDELTILESIFKNDFN